MGTRINKGNTYKYQSKSQTCKTSGSLLDAN